MYARTLHAYACAYGVDALVVALYSHLGAFARYAYYLLDGDEAVENLGHFHLEEPFEEGGRCPREGDARGAVLHLHVADDSLQSVALAEEVARYLLLLGQGEVVAVFVADKDFSFPYLIYLARNHFADAVLVFFVELLFLKFKNLRRQVLTQGEYGTPSEVLEFDFVGDLLVDFVVGVDARGLRE